MTQSDQVGRRLADWLRTQLPDADDVRVEGLDRVEFGHSAEMMVLTVVTQRGGIEERQDVVLRLRPPPPALLEPYDLKRQFDILRALEHTLVRVPRALWLEDSGDVLGREFFIMDRVAGDVYEMETPDLPDESIRRMCESMAEQLGAIHSIDRDLVDLGFLGDGRDHLDKELDHWADEMHRVQRATLPALERLLKGAARDQTGAERQDRARARGREARQLRLRRRRGQRRIRLGDDHNRRSTHRHRVDGTALDAARRHHQPSVGNDH